MTVVANAFRGFLNLTASGLLLLIAVVTFGAASTVPHQQSHMEAGDIATMAFFAVLTCLSAYLTWKFWTHRPSASSSTACSILNAVACLLLIATFGFFFVRG